MRSYCWSANSSTAGAAPRNHGPPSDGRFTATLACLQQCRPIEGVRSAATGARRWSLRRAQADVSLRPRRPPRSLARTGFRRKRRSARPRRFLPPRASALPRRRGPVTRRSRFARRRGPRAGGGESRRADHDIDRQFPGDPHDLRDFVGRLHSRARTAHRRRPRRKP